MLVKREVLDLEERLKGEFDYLQKKYSTVAFNVHDWWGKPNDRSNGKNILLTTEGYITIPNDFNPDFIKNYDVCITYNHKFKELHPELNIVTIDGVTNWEDYFELDNFLSYDEKIKGVCSIQTVYKTGRVGDINFMKDTVMKQLNVAPELIKHTFGPKPFGNPSDYQGHLKFKHGHYENLKKINEYLFCWCPESTYHELWSHGHVTERIFNSFKSKTIAIYYGCYNIEELIPKDLYIDYRDFSSLDELSKYLIELSKDKDRYNKIVESAYEWNLNNKIGSMVELEKVLQECVTKYPFNK
jgi:glycosyl transferase family 10 (putative fucosyltransferase)